MFFTENQIRNLLLDFQGGIGTSHSLQIGSDLSKTLALAESKLVLVKKEPGF